MLPPSYYPAFYGGEKGLRDFYVDLAAESTIPIIIYSYPGVSSGIDMSSNLISSIFKVIWPWTKPQVFADTRLYCDTGCSKCRGSQAYRPQRWQDRSRSGAEPLENSLSRCL